jgi:hypothetical protein
MKKLITKTLPVNNKTTVSYKAMMNSKKLDAFFDDSEESD